MIADLAVARRPRVDVHVLKLGLARERAADVHVIELLRVHVEDVAVPLRRVDAAQNVEILQARARRKGFERRDEGELVEVARCDDRCPGVVRENVRDEVLQQRVALFSFENENLPACTKNEGSSFQRKTPRARFDAEGSREGGGGAVLPP